MPNQALDSQWQNSLYVPPLAAVEIKKIQVVTWNRELVLHFGFVRRCSHIGLSDSISSDFVSEVNAFIIWDM